MRIKHKSILQKSLNLFLFVALTCCSPRAPQIQPGPQTTVPTPSVTPTAEPTVSPTIPPLPTLDPGLPAECRQYDPAIEPVYYADFSDGACDNASWSPDRSLVAYATPIRDLAGEVTRQLRLYDTVSGDITSIYTSQCGNLLPEWANGLLVISDLPQDVGCGFTAVYDPSSQIILDVIEGSASTAWSDGFNSNRSAFFAFSPEDFGPACSETLSGYDLNPPQKAPAILPVDAVADLYVVVGQPIWSVDGKTLTAVLRDGVCTGESFEDCTYSNAYILAFDFNQSPPALSRPYADPLHDYNISISALGEMEISSSPTTSLNCLEIAQQEASLEE